MRELMEGRAWLARVSGAGAVGAAFAVDPQHLLTCAHVVLDAGAQGPGDTVSVEFPLLHANCESEVLAEGWQPEAGTAGDVALLRLAKPPEGLRPAPLRSLRSLAGLPFTAYGFPAGYDDSVPAEGILGKAAGLQWITLNVGAGLSVEPGFSGGAVWSDRHQAVVGVMVTRDEPTQGRVAFAIPIRTIAPVSPMVADALPTPLDLDPALTTHWDPQARGVAAARDHRWLFTGRTRALTDLVGWLTSNEPPALRVVTGSPGSGKSAVLARLVTTTDRHYRRQVPDLRSDDPAVPPPGALDVTFHAKGRTVAQFIAHVSAVCDLETDGLQELLAAVDRFAEPLVIAVDALEESSEPVPLCRLLDDLAVRGARILVGCRPHLIAQLSDPCPLRLDEAPYLEAGDVESYVRRALGEGRESPAREVAEAAEGNFLVARLLIEALALGGELERPLPGDVPRAFGQLLDALGEPESRRARELLLPVAYAFGAGLPDDLWLTGVAALSRPYQRGDLRELLSGPAGSFLVTTLDTLGGPRRRLFHQALADSLCAESDPGGDQRLLWDAWTAPLRKGEHVRWSDAPAYLCEQAAEHAAAAGTLTELAKDNGYLLAGDLRRLLIQLETHKTEGDPETLALLRLATRLSQPLDAPERATLLALAAHHLGLHSRAKGVEQRAVAPWRLRWAQWLMPPSNELNHGPHQLFGEGHQETVSAGFVGALATGQVGGREIVVSGDDDGILRLWDAASGEPLGEPVRGHDGPVEAVAVGRAGGSEVVVSAGTDGAVRLWDALEVEPLRDLLRGDPIWAIAFGRADEREVLAVAGMGGVRLLDLGDLDAGSTTLAGGDAVAVALGTVHGHGIVASGWADGAVRLWDTANGGVFGEALRGHTGAVRALAVGRVDGRDVVASGGDDGTVRLWDAAACKPLGDLLPETEKLRGDAGRRPYRAPIRVRAVAFGALGGREVLASCGTIKVRLWDACTRVPVAVIAAHEPVVSLALTSNNLCFGCMSGICCFENLVGRPGSAVERRLR